MVDYKVVENLLLRILSILVGVFSESEANEVTEFINAGEYGLALDTLIDIIDEESKSVPQEVVELAKQTAIAMNLDGIVMKKRLEGVVSAK